MQLEHSAIAAQSFRRFFLDCHQLVPNEHVRTHTWRMRSLRLGSGCPFTMVPSLRECNGDHQYPALFRAQYADVPFNFPLSPA